MICSNEECPNPAGIHILRGEVREVDDAAYLGESFCSLLCLITYFEGSRTRRLATLARHPAGSSRKENHSMAHVLTAPADGELRSSPQPRRG